MLLADSRTARVLVTVLLFALALGFLYVARATLIAFLFAIFFAYLMSPLVNRLESLLRGRVRAIAVIYALLLALVVVFFVVVGPKVTHEGARLGQALPDLLTQLSSGEIAKQLGLEHGWSKTSTEVVQSFLVSHSDEITQLAQRIGLRVADVAKQAWLFFVVPLLSIFFLKDGRSFSDFLLSAIQSRPQREFLENVLNDLNQMLAHFIRAQLTLAALTLVMYSAFLGVMGVPYALVLGTIGRSPGIRSRGRPARRALVIVSVALLHELQALADPDHLSRDLALAAGLRFFSSHHGREHGTASFGRDLRRHGRRRGRRHPGRLSFHSRDGQLCASSSAAGASMPKRKSSAPSPNIPSARKRPIVRSRTRR